MSKTELSNVDGYTPVIDKVRDECGIIPAVLFGVVWRFCQMDGGKCTASQSTIAERAGISNPSARMHLKTLVQKGYLTAETVAGIGITYEDTGKAGTPLKFNAPPLNSSEPPVKIYQATPLKFNDKESLLRDSLRDNTNNAAALLSIWTAITGMIFYPANKTEDIAERLDGLQKQHNETHDALTNYLRPYWQEWTRRRYSKTNPGWLDWAVAGEIPEQRSKNGNGAHPAIEPPMTEERKAAIKAEMKRLREEQKKRNGVA